MGGPDVEVADETGCSSMGLLAELEKAAWWTLREEDAAGATLSIALVSDATIGELNRQYLSRDGPTDVISFPLDGPGDRMVGDVYIGREQAERQAAEIGVTVREELIRLVVHGTLHVLGWDHPEDAAAREESAMYRRQEELVAGFLGAQR